MSDSENQAVESDRMSTEQEVEATLGGFAEAVDQGIGATRYVAPPAEGHDIHGLWHNFDAHSRTGYTCHAVALHKMLDAIGIRTQLTPHRGLDIDIDRFPEDRSEQLFEWTKNAVGRPKALLCSFPPEVAQGLAAFGMPLVPYCAFEGTKVSAFAAELINKPDLFAKVWVVSPLVERAMIEGGVEPDRVRVVRPAIWGDPWLKMGYREQLLKDMAGHEPPVDADAPYVFGAMGTWHERKGFPDLLRAYFGRFTREQNVKLVLRTSAFGDMDTIRRFKEKVIEDIAEIAKEFGDDNFPASKKMPRITLELGTGATDAEIIQWLGSLDCYVNATYGEGLGIPHVWAKGQGVPMISSSYGAVPEMLNELKSDFDLQIPHYLEPVDPIMPRIGLMFDPDTEWGKYNVTDLTVAMNQKFEAGRRIDYEGAMKTRELFSTETTLPALKAALAELVGEEWAGRWRLV